MKRINEAMLDRLGAAGQAVWVWDPAAGRIAWASQKAADAWHSADPFILTDRPFGAMDPARTDMMAVFEALEDGSRKVETSIRFWAADGRHSIDVVAQSWPPPSDDIEGGGLVLFQVEAPVRGQTQAPATYPEDELDLLFRNYPSAIALFSPRGPCLYANPAFEAIAGLGTGPSLMVLAGSAANATKLVQTVLSARAVRTSPILRVGKQRMSFDMDAVRVVDPRTERDAVLVSLENTTARRRLEKQLQQQLNSVQLLLESAVEAWIMLDSQRRFVAYGGRGLQRFQGRLDLSIGRPWSSVQQLIGLKVDKSAEAAQAPANGQPQKLLRFQDMSSDVLWRATTQKHRRTRTSPGGYHILFHRVARPVEHAPKTAPDLSKIAKPKRRSSPTALWAAASEALIAHDNFDIVFANAAAARLFGYANPEELIGKPFLDLFPEDEPRAARHYDETADIDDGFSEARLRARHTGGQLRWLNTAFRRTQLNDRAIILMAATDITDLVEISDRYDGSDSAESLGPHDKRWLDDVPVPMAALDTAGIIVHVNQLATDLLTKSDSDLIGQSFETLVRRKDWAAFEIRLAAAARATEGDPPIIYATALTIDGGEWPVTLTFQSRHIDGAAGTVIVINSDEAGRRDPGQGPMPAMNTPNTDDVRQTDILATISHEMRTPLNAIIGFSETMKEGRLGPIDNEKYAAYVDDIHMSGQHLLSLVNDLLDMSKIQAGHYEIDLTELQPASVIADALRIVHPLANQKGITLIEDFAPDLPNIVADERSVKQILINLATNGIKYTPAGGSVTIGATPETRDPGERAGLTIFVEDTGIGMTDDEIIEAQKPFRQIRRQQEKQSGTGLGLPLAKALSAANKAELHIESAPTKGTRVEVRFLTPQ